jgi:hypothetical protein
MTETQKINAEANSAFEKEDYPLAFSTLWKTSVYNFISYIEKDFKTHNPKTNVIKIKVNWFNNESASQYFWNTFIVKEEVFYNIFESD